VKYSTVHYSIVRSDPEDLLIDSEHSREKSQPSRQQQQTASPVSCDDSIMPLKAIDLIRDGQEGVPVAFEHTKGWTEAIRGLSTLINYNDP
jgi:hypothetical protein